MRWDTGGGCLGIVCLFFFAVYALYIGSACLFSKNGCPGAQTERQSICLKGAQNGLEIRKCER